MQRSEEGLGLDLEGVKNILQSCLDKAGLLVTELSNSFAQGVAKHPVGNGWSCAEATLNDVNRKYYGANFVTAAIKELTANYWYIDHVEKMKGQLKRFDSFRRPTITSPFPSKSWEDEDKRCREGRDECLKNFVEAITNFRSELKIIVEQKREEDIPTDFFRRWAGVVELSTKTLGFLFEAGTLKSLLTANKEILGILNSSNAQKERDRLLELQAILDHESDVANWLNAFTPSSLSTSFSNGSSSTASYSSSSSESSNAQPSSSTLSP